jgi:predicted dehydrogenase
LSVEARSGLLASVRRPVDRPGEAPKRSEGRVRAAVVGAGLMGRWHASELPRAGGALVAVADSDAAAAASLAHSHPGVSAFSDPATMLREAAPEVVHLCTPTASHVELTERCLEAGAHVLVEKPLAPDAAATGALLERAEQRGLMLCPVHQYPFQSGVAQARRALPDLGRPVLVEATACSAGGEHLPDSPLDEIAGEILPHPLSLLALLLEPAVDRLAWSATRPAEGEVRAGAAVDGATVSISISMRGRPTRNELRLIAEAGTLHLDLFHGYAFAERGSVSRLDKALRPFAASAARVGAAGANLALRAVRREPAYPGLRELIRGFYSAVREGGSSPVPPDEALAVARARDAILSAL